MEDKKDIPVANFSIQSNNDPKDIIVTLETDNLIPPEKTFIKKSDKWTVIGSIFGFAKGVVGHSYSIGTVVDYIGFKPQILGLSIPGFSVGLAVGFYLTVCSSYAHFILNKRHQKSDMEDQHVNGRNPKIYKDKYKDLTVAQKFIYAGDLVTHGLDYASPLILTSKLALGNKQTILEKSGTIVLSGLFGFFGSKSHVRTCENAIIDENVDHKMESHRQGIYSKNSSYENLSQNFPRNDK